VLTPSRVLLGRGFWPRFIPVVGAALDLAYRRFPTKHALIEELMVDRLGDVEAIARECVDEPDPWLGLSGFFERARADGFPRSSLEAARRSVPRASAGDAE
jgi:hypothetical protein